MLAAASAEYSWDLDLALIAKTWRRGSIIQSDMLTGIAIRLAHHNDNILPGLLSTDCFLSFQDGWRHAVVTAIMHGIPVPCFSSALAFYDGLRSDKLPASLIQAQRDFFGSHGFERCDMPHGIKFHSRFGKK